MAVEPEKVRYILLRNYIKSQPRILSFFILLGYILLRNYIKSQLENRLILLLKVISY